MLEAWAALFYLDCLFLCCRTLRARKPADTLLLCICMKGWASLSCAHLDDWCRNARYWSNADTFDPDRFPVDGPIPNEVTEVYNYLPFGGGRRKCIGEKLAVIAYLA